MPQERRKRGKKNKGNNAPTTLSAEGTRRPDTNVQRAEIPTQPEAGPSWIVSSANEQTSSTAESDSPFGDVDVDTKAYFRTVDIQIRNWQDSTGPAADGDIDPNEGFICLSRLE
jgi:nucleolar protein 9